MNTENEKNFLLSIIETNDLINSLFKDGIFDSSQLEIYLILHFKLLEIVMNELKLNKEMDLIL